MLNCREVTEHASGLIDGELSWMQRLQMRLHLAMCKHCSRFVRQLRLLRAALGHRRQVAGEPLPESEVGRILDGLPFPPREPRQD
jgi:anti-sigma factor RsiW